VPGGYNCAKRFIVPDDLMAWRCKAKLDGVLRAGG
jgi:hypothetical protein